MRTSVRGPVPSTTPYYHGTSALAAVCISADGFRLLPTLLRSWGDGALGHGIYVTAALETASFFADLGDGNGLSGSQRYIVRVKMTAGTRILRLDGQYDPRIIKYLGREFGKELFSPDFDRAIPSNKHLSRIELINLANYLWVRGGTGKPGGIAAWSGIEDQGPLRRYLVQHKYHGMGCLNTDLGVVVFDPSKLLADGVFQLSGASTGAGASHSATCLVEPDLLLMATTAAESIRIAKKGVRELRTTLAQNETARNSSARFDHEELAAYLTELPRWQRCLRAFCTQHAVPTASPPISSVLPEPVPK